MNLETLKKYWNELEHYKNGGSLLARIWITDDNDGDESYTIWYKVGCECWDINKVFNYTLDYHKLQIIINDEYSIYRKALAEGETIQINNSNPETWIDIDTDKLAHYNPSFLRIKPDESKFKVGDFVTPLNRKINCSVWQIDKVLSCNTLVSGSTLLDPRIIQLWMPVKGEWCWFYDNPKKDKYCNLSQFGEESNGRCFKTNSGTPWNFCEPFLNSMPSYLKDK